MKPFTSSMLSSDEIASEYALQPNSFQANMKIGIRTLFLKGNFRVTFHLEEKINMHSLWSNQSYY